MRNSTKRSLALLLVLVQLVTLLPALSLRAQAAGTTAETPALNKTTVGTVKFQSFNFLGDNAAGSDGVDYTSTFYYSDDYFSPSAIHETSTPDCSWSDLTPNEQSLASVSFDLTVAAYASNERNVLTATSRTWDNTDYSDKQKNARDMLTACGFEDFEAYHYNHAPTNDSIGYVIARKPIHVWDPVSGTNRDYTLIAVAVRGAGYGAEWANNVSIGDTATNKLPANGRHWGFDKAAQEVCASIQAYIADKGVTENAKYWITGFSRAGAAANLVAGYVTDGAESIYHTHQRDVYGFTWECPQAASTSENALNYKNIHNILNAMDAVPKVSPDAFQHQRLGVDYVMPYYGNTTTAQNTAYYTNMREVLKTIAVGADNYAGQAHAEDPLISVTDPANYPYNRPVSIYTVSARQLIDDGLSGTFGDNFGTVHVVTGWYNRLSRGYVNSILGNEKWYMDQFIDELIDVFLVSPAWDRDYGDRNTVKNYAYDRKVALHEARFIGNYQKDFRNVLGYLLDYAGPSFLGMVDSLMDAVGNKIGTVSWNNVWSNVGFALDFAKFYFGSTNESNRMDLINSSREMAVSIVNDMTSNFTDPQNISRSDMNDSLRHLVSLVIDLYADELDDYESQYFGTSLHNLWQILCTHEQEVVMSWIKSLDPNHTNRGYRTFTVPAGTDVKLYEFRSQYGETLGFDADAPLVAEFKNGAAVSCLDDRISVTVSGADMVIRYPSLLDLRMDVSTDTQLDDLAFRLADYSTKAMATALSDGEKQYDPARTTASNYTAFASNGAREYNAMSNSTVIPLAPGEKVSVTARHTTSYNENDTSVNLFYAMRKSAVKLVDFSATMPVAASVGNVDTKTESGGAFSLANATLSFTPDASAGAGSFRPFAGMSTAAYSFAGSSRASAGKVTVIPAASIYYDDDFTGRTIASDGSGYSADVQASPAQADLAKGQYTFSFTGTGIDIYCTTYDKVDETTPVGYIQAKLDGDNDTTVTMRSQSDVTRYNVPTISFTGLENKAHTVTLNVLSSSHYKFDGVRVYNSVENQSLYDGTDEQYATFVNLRKALVNDDPAQPVTIDQNQYGALYVDHPASMGEEPTFEAYQTNSPKNEIYLAPGKAITFTLSPAAQTGRLWIGLSAPDAEGSQTGTVTAGGTPVSVTSAVDMYYPITAGGNTVTVTNTGTTMISVTNLKITGVRSVYDAAAEAAASPAGAASLNEAVFAPLTMEALRLAANGGAEPDAAKPVWSDGVDSVQAVLNTLFRTLLSTLEALFRNVTAW